MLVATQIIPFYLCGSRNCFVFFTQEVLQQLPDVEQLLTLCMQTPSTIDSNQAMETRVNYVLMLKATMETLPRLATALEKVKSYALSKAKEVCKIETLNLDTKLFSFLLFLIILLPLQCLQDPRGDLIKGRILHTLNEDVKAPKGGKTATFQRCFAIKSGINDLMDVARKTYCELISDMHGNFSSHMFKFLPLVLFYIYKLSKHNIC